MATVEQFALPAAKSFISLFRFHSKTVGGGKTTVYPNCAFSSHTRHRKRGLIMEMKWLNLTISAIRELNSFGFLKCNNDLYNLIKKIAKGLDSVLSFIILDREH